MLSEHDLNKIREELDNCKRPLFFFHDDPDGLSSFLLLYRYKTEGKGIVVKSQPKIDEKFVLKVSEYMPDKVFILDIPLVEQDFLDKVARMKISVVYIDHHNPLKLRNVLYFNPRKANPKDDTCVTRLCYAVVKRDLWIAMVGAIGDWQMPKFWDAFMKKYPGLIESSVKLQQEALFGSKLGELVRVFSFVLKGDTDSVVKCMKVLTRIKEPYDILEQKTPPGRFIYTKYRRIKDYYDALLKKALENVTKDELFVFIYKGERFSFTSDLANELQYRYPTKIIIVGREKSGEIKYSLRSSKLLPPLIKKALEGVEGYGGGHEHAGGSCVKVKDNERFIKQFKKAL